MTANMSLSNAPGEEELSRVAGALDQYAPFVSGMAFAGDPEIPSFDQAVEAIGRLSRLLPE